MPTTAQRGYGYAHQTLRRYWTPYVNAGLVTCWRCNRLIQPGTPWDLGHDDHDRSVYRGPEHAHCNRSAAALKGNKSPKRKHGATWRPQPPEYRPTERTWTVTPSE